MSSHSAASFRRPSFMAGMDVAPSVTLANFGGGGSLRDKPADRLRDAGRVRAMSFDTAASSPTLEPELEGEPLPEEIHLPAGATHAAPAPVFVPQVVVPPPPPPVDLSRLEAAVDRLRMLSDRLAAEVRADAVEVAIMLARKIVEGEITMNVDRLLGSVRSAVRRVGESRRIIVRLCPEDAEALNAATKGNYAELGGGVARVEIISDASFGRADCVVEGDLGEVDARLDSRLNELRRALTDGAEVAPAGEQA